MISRNYTVVLTVVVCIAAACAGPSVSSKNKSSRKTEKPWQPVWFTKTAPFYASGFVYGAGLGISTNPKSAHQKAFVNASAETARGIHAMVDTLMRAAMSEVPPDSIRREETFCCGSGMTASSEKPGLLEIARSDSTYDGMEYRHWIQLRIPPVHVRTALEKRVQTEVAVMEKLTPGNRNFKANLFLLRHVAAHFDRLGKKCFPDVFNG
jgi:hypothetical protein